MNFDHSVPIAFDTGSDATDASLLSIQTTFRNVRNTEKKKVEDIHCLKKGEKAEEAFAGVSEFWDKDLEYFEALTTAESQLILADNHHFENNDLFVIDE